MWPLKKEPDPQLETLESLLRTQNDLIKNQNQTLYAIKAIQVDILNKLVDIHNAFYEEENNG